jgi:hypothetical protein
VRETDSDFLATANFVENLDETESSVAELLPSVEVFDADKSKSPFDFFEILFTDVFFGADIVHTGFDFSMIKSRSEF